METKEVLWNIASQAMLKARHLSANASLTSRPTLLDETHKLIHCAVSALEAVLLTKPLSPSDELVTRVALADVLLTYCRDGGVHSVVETHLHKATLIAQKFSTPTPQIFHVKALHLTFLLHSCAQSKIKPHKTCVPVIKECLLMSESVKAMDWWFYFMDRWGTMLTSEGEWKGAGAAWKEAAEKARELGDSNTQALFCCKQAIMFMSIRDVASAEQAISPELAAIRPAGPSEPGATQRYTPTKRDVLWGYAMILKALALSQRGNRKEAKVCAEEVVAETERWIVDDTDSGLVCEGEFGIDTGAGGPVNSEVGAAGVSGSQVRLVSWLVVGALTRDVDGPRVVDLLQRCLQEVKSDRVPLPHARSVEDIAEWRRWCMEAYLIASHHLVEVYLLTGNIEKADEALQSLVKLIQSLSSEEITQTYLPTILLNWGLVNQAKGDTALATRCYFGAAAYASERRRQCRVGSVEAVVCEELQVVASFCNVILLLSSDDAGNVDLAMRVLEDLKKDVKEPFVPHTVQKTDGVAFIEFDHVKAFLSLSNAMVAHRAGEIKKTKLHLLEALRSSDMVLSNQLKTSVLTFLGSLFFETDAKQAEKMVSTALKLCKKSGCGSVARVCESALEELRKKKG